MIEKDDNSIIPLYFGQRQRIIFNLYLKANENKKNERRKVKRKREKKSKGRIKTMIDRIRFIYLVNTK